MKNINKNMKGEIKMYKRNDIINKLKKIDINQLYTNKMVNYHGKTSDTNEKYTEVIAKEILENNKNYDFNNIKQINRKQGYKINTHTGEFNKNSNRREEIIAMKMYNNNYLDIGKMLDYQIPLKDHKGTKAGKIDLISYKEDTNTLYLIELKNDVSAETLLRCTLEIITYLNQINQSKLKSDFELNDKMNIKPAILIFEGTRPYYDINDEYVNKLIKKFKIDVFVAKSQEVFNIKKI